MQCQDEATGWALRHSAPQSGGRKDVQETFNIIGKTLCQSAWPSMTWHVAAPSPTTSTCCSEDAEGTLHSEFDKGRLKKG